jgi:hypothetical protein
MNKFFLYRRCLQLAMVTLLVVPELVNAQSFTAGNGDLVAGFRKYNPAGSYELVVNIGNITNFLSLTGGQSTSIGNFSPIQLTDAFPNYNNLQWSVFSTVTGPPSRVFAGFQQATIWYTLPRAVVGTQTTPPTRDTQEGQNSATTPISTIDGGANIISTGLSLGTDNSSVLVREPIAGANGNDYATSVEDTIYNAVADFNNYLPTTIENTTPASFTSAVVSDLYQVVPSDYVDPYNSSTQAYYVGYFTLNPSGTMTFTRASAIVAQPPVPRIVSITRSGSNSTVFFTTTNATFTYTLYYTNSAGLTTSVTNWPASPTTLIGNGNTNSLSDTTTDTNRFYRIGVH